jgi:hypothetical protein
VFLKTFVDTTALVTQDGKKPCGFNTVYIVCHAKTALSYLSELDGCWRWELVPAEEAVLLELVLLPDALRSSVDKPSPFSKAPTASRPASYSSSIRLLNPAGHGIWLM